jgi:PKD repeat protein
MTSRRCCVALLFAISTLWASPYAYSEIIVAVDSAGGRHLIDTDDPGNHAMPPAKAKRDFLVKSGFTWSITYQDIINGSGVGFDDPTHGPDRRSVVLYVLDYIERTLNVSSGATIDVHFNASETDGGGSLAYAGTYFSQSPGFQGGYCQQHITTGTDPSVSVVDIYCTVDFGHPWYVGTGTPAFSEYDFYSVMLHEMTHGLGFLSLAEHDGASDVYPGAYAFYDDFLRTGTMIDLFQASGGTVVYNGNPNSLTGIDGGVFLAAPQASAAHGSNPQIYAPSTWKPGSSISHWDTSLSGDWVMKPGIANGVTRRVYHPVEYATLHDIGYPNAADPVTVPVAEFTASPLAGNAPLDVQFSDETTGIPASWEWDFDNNGAVDSTTRNPLHQYSTLGAWSVELVASNTQGSDTRLRPFYIRVYGPRAAAWMDFAYAGIALGTETQPFALFSEALDALESGGTLQIKGDTSQNSTDQMPTLSKPMRIEAVNGAVRIGAP